MTRIAIQRALISVYDKTGLEELAAGLRAAGANMLRSLLLPAGPSGPSPTARPRANIFVTGAAPLASFILLDGQCAMPAPRSRKIRRSASSVQTACATSVRPLKIPRPSRAAVGVFDRFAIVSSFSRRVSER